MTDRSPRLESYRPRQDLGPSRAGARQSGPRRGPARKTSGWINAFFYIAIGLLAVVAAAITFVVVLAPTDMIRDRLIQEVQARTGRDLKIAGPTSMTVFPSLGLSLSEVSLSAPRGMGGEPTVRMRSLEVAVAAWPLLAREVVVERLVLREPVFDLRIDRQGRRSWDHASVEGQGEPRLRYAQAGAPAAGPMPKELEEFVRGSSQASKAGPAKASPLGALSLGDVRIENGTVRYADERTGLSEEVGAIETRIAMKNLASPFTAAGSAALRRERFTFDLRIAEPERLLAGQASRVTGRLAGRPVTASFDGQVTQRQGLETDGAVTLDAGSLAGILRFIGRDVADQPGLGALSIKGQLKTTANAIQLSGADAKLEEMRIGGTVGAEFGGPRPLVRGNLKIASLDVDRYVGAANAVARAPAAAPPRAVGPSTEPRTIEDLIRGTEPAAVPPVPKVKGFSQRSGWSEAPLDLAALGALDADLRLSLSSLAYRNIKVGAASANVGLKAQMLRVDIDDMQLYEGRGRGVVTVDATGGETASVGANIAVSDIAALPLLTDAAGFDWLAGKGRLNLAIGGRGASERQIVETLTGKADVTFVDGAIVGFNVAQILRGLGQGRISGFDRVATERTDFSELAASFQIAGGVAQNQDLRLTSPLLRMTGSGRANLADRTLDYTVKPRLVASLSGQGGQQNLTGVDLPVRITGPWEKLVFTPDIAGVVNNPEQVLDAVREVTRQLKGKSADEIVRDITGPDGRINPGRLLDQLLKR